MKQPIEAVLCTDISIPRGAVKSPCTATTKTVFLTFQFQEVQLKERRPPTFQELKTLFQFQEVQLKGALFFDIAAPTA